MTSLLDLGYEQKSSFKPVEEGIYDAVIHGIVHLGVQPQLDDPKTGKPKPPRGTLKIVFELPDVIRDDGQTGLISKNMPMSGHEKSGYYKLFAACLGHNKTNSEVVISTSVETLLGKKLALTIVNWSNPESGKSGAKVPENGINFLDARLSAVAKPATRPVFFFTPLNPDLDVFNNILTYWTQKTVMEALNASSYPEELHKAWVAIQEARADSTLGTDLKGTNTDAIE